MGMTTMLMTLSAVTSTSCKTLGLAAGQEAVEPQPGLKINGDKYEIIVKIHLCPKLCSSLSKQSGGLKHRLH